MEFIKSKDNPIVKKIVSIKSNRRERHSLGLFVAEGLRFCRDAVLSGTEIKVALITQDFLQKHPDDARNICNAANEVKCISDLVSQKISDTVNSQGVFCLCAIKENKSELCGKRFIALENLQDPGNLGTIIRTAEAFGIDGVVLIGNCVDIYSPKVLRSTMGTIFRIPFYSFNDNEAANEQFKKLGLTVYGAVLDDNAKLLSKTGLCEKAVCLIGNEANGISQEAKNICDKFVMIDMNGNAESLNAAVAASVIMWEMTK